MKKNKGFIGIGMFIAIIVAALAVGGGATYYATKNSQKVQENNVVDNSQQIPQNNNYQKIPGNENGVINSNGQAPAVNPAHPEQAQNTSSEKEISLKIKSNVESFMASHNYKSQTTGNISSCSSVLYGYENNYAYAWVFCGEYDKNFKLGPASSVAVRVTYNSNYEITAIKEGSECCNNQIEDKQIFGKYYDISSKGPSNEIRASLQSEALNKIKNLSSNNHSPLSSCLPTDPASVHVISPNGGETFIAGQSITVKWNTCNLLATDKVAIGLMRQYNNGFSFVNNGDTRVYNLPNNGIATFTLLPITENAGMVYKIDVDVTRTGQVWDQEDTSDNLFTINPAPANNHSPQVSCASTDPASIHITSPNGGETWTRGQQATVTWTSCNIPATTQLQIDLSESVSSGEHTTSAPIIQSTPNDGSETFTVSNTMWDYFVGPVGYPFKIYITGSVPPTGPMDYSDNSFSIN
ncbi:MAG: hypothetical protein NTW62_00530 [Candidatus Nomurabacteria bacterium]|nr:hypothetical protein [Candidatus Nomurabacteria bacterium]